MVCPECDQTVHMDSVGVTSCISCGYSYNQATQSEYRPKEFTYNNSGLVKPIQTNDAGEILQSTEDTLKERGNRYGEFANHAQLSQKFKIVFNDHVNDHGRPRDFTPFMSEALEMIFHKLARIANGDPTYIDSWTDVCGYSQLVIDELTVKERG